MTIHAAAKLLIDLELPECAVQAPERMGLTDAQIDYLYPMLRVTFFAGYLMAKREAECGRLGQLEREMLACDP